MKPNYFIRHILIALLSWLALSVWLVSNTAVAAVEYQVLQSLGQHGGNPYSKLIQDSTGNLYGTTSGGGSKGFGSVFKLDASGNASILHSFDGGSGGDTPYAGLTLGSDGNFYGTTYYGGGSNAGIVFKIDASGNFSVAHEFDGAGGGANPRAGLIQGSDGSFYGTTYTGGGSNAGTIFKIDASGNFSILYEFDGAGNGAYPYAGLIQGADGSLYGTSGGGSSGNGIVFKLDLSGIFTVLHSFEGGSGGSSPSASLVKGSDGGFYGTTLGGGSTFVGTVFKIDNAGAFSVLHDFDSYGGAFPYGDLIQGSDGSFYGTTSSNIKAAGNVFKIDSSGNFTVLHDFDSTDGGGSQPYAGLIQGNDGYFYGTTYAGGDNSTGTVFRMDESGNVSVLHSFEGNAPGFPATGLIQGSDGNFYGATSGDGGPSGPAAIFKYDTEGNFSILREFIETDHFGIGAKLTQADDDSFYGITYDGGSLSSGSLFKLDTSGTYSILYEFDEGSGEGHPFSKLVQDSDGNFYGTTYGSLTDGVVFKLDSSGNYSVLHNFDGAKEGGSSTNLIQGSDGSFYGATSYGGSFGAGTVFKIDPSGNFSIIHEFEGGAGWTWVNGMIQGKDGNFYGTTYGSYYDDLYGTVFKLDASGNFSTLHTFDYTTGSTPNPELLQTSDGSLYGTTYQGGSGGVGTIFKIDSSGNISVLHHFDWATDGGSPYSGLILGSDGYFYGTTYTGGTFGAGTIFQLVETTDNPEPPDNTVSVALSSSPNPSLRGQRVTFTATVTGNSPTGTVQFLDGSKKLGTMPLINGVATVSTSRLKSGRHLITAVYSGDANNASFTSTPLVHGVKAVAKKELRARPRGTLG